MFYFLWCPGIFPFRSDNHESWTVGVITLCIPLLFSAQNLIYQHWSTLLHFVVRTVLRGKINLSEKATLIWYVCTRTFVKMPMYYHPNFIRHLKSTFMVWSQLLEFIWQCPSHFKRHIKQLYVVASDGFYLD